MLERFSEAARRVVGLAQDEARGFAHDHVGTEHLLLGLLGHGEGRAASMLEDFEVTLDEIRAQVERVVGRGDAQETGLLPFTPRATRVLDGALPLALSLGDGTVEREHILLALVEERQGTAARILRDFDVGPREIRMELGAAPHSCGDEDDGDIETLSVAVPGYGPAWEYRVVALESVGELDDELLNRLGADGWELVAVVGERELRLVLKRFTPPPAFRDFPG